jgi:hypothetical protein
MNEAKLSVESTKTVPESTVQKAKPAQKPAWETPKMEDVSEQVMAQPYIRFT